MVKIKIKCKVYIGFFVKYNDNNIYIIQIPS